MRYIVYVDQDPNDLSKTVTIRRSEKEALKWMNNYAFNQHGYVYETDRMAIEDYISLHWAWWEDKL